MKKSLFVLGVLAFAGAAASGQVSGVINGSTPSPLSFVLNYNQMSNGSVDTTVRIPGTGGGDVDVAFVSDTTGSMGSYLSTANSVFTSVLNNVAASLPAVNFKYGVFDYKDFGDGGTYATKGYRTGTAFTSSIATAQAAIGAQSASGGGDAPEENLKALSSIATNWVAEGGRASAKKLSIYVGDVQGHNNNTSAFYPSLNATAAALNAAGVRQFGINPGAAGTGIDATQPGDPGRQASTLASATGGQVFFNVGFGNAAAISAALINAITTGSITVGSISLTVDGALGGWDVQVLNSPRVGPFDASDSPVNTLFNLKITAPAVDDERIVTLSLRADGGVLDTIPLHLKSIPTPSALALVGLGGLVAGRRRRA